MEFWDIYDKDKKPTGRTMKKNDWILKDGEYHLSVLGVIHRPDGRFLITQRVMTKAWAPGWWEVSGGAAQAGESSFTAVCREVKEEVGLDVSQCPGGLAYTYHRENPGGVTTISWMFTALSLISRSLTYRFRQRRHLGLKLPHSMK